MSGYTTPTREAEAVYQAKLDARVNRERITGPAGIPIPLGKHIYRKVADADLLHRIVKVSYAHWRRSVLTPAKLNAVSASLTADLLRRFPPADMAVLERYQLATRQDFAFVEILCGAFEPHEKVAIGSPLLPHNSWTFHVDLGGRGSSNAPPVPQETVPFFRELVSVRQEKGRSFETALHWPSQFRRREGRFPRWQEIEAQFPIIGAWLEGQRNA